jgi:uncharacterized SAM-binding protein YcdF (DUF218 family)
MGLVLLTLGGLITVAAAALIARVHRFGRRRPSLTPRDAIVVLGARVLPDGTASEALSARVDHAVRLHRQGVGKLLVFSGAGGAAQSEAAVASQLAQAAGVAPRVCVLEDQSHSTFENATRCAALMASRGLRRVWVVTDDFHALRAFAHFRRAGLDVELAPVRRALPPLRRLLWTAREALALVRRPWLLR